MDTETAYEWESFNPGIVWFSSNESSEIRRMMKLASQNPEVIIRRTPETNGGYIYGSFPRAWLRVKPPRQLSEKERTARMRSLEIANKARKDERNHDD